VISSLELARECGISQGTVDRALHNRPGISPRTRDRVLRAARRYGYQPNPAARELLTGQSNVIGAVLPAVNNIFFMDLFNELGRAFAEQGLRLQITPVENRDIFLKVLQELAARRCRLAITVPPEDNIPVPAAITASLPLISLFSPLRGRGLHILSLDEEKTGRDAVRYLHERGHRRILHLTYARKAYAIDARVQGYRKQCREMNLPSRVMVTIDAEALTLAVKQYRPSAIFCHNDWMALQVLLRLSEMGVRVPEDISVLGVDNSPTLDAINSRLTTLAYPMASAVRAVMKILAGKSTSLKRESYKLIERATVRNLEVA
jgi:LacI family transcriptional regulator